jgi:hypothetical protein
MKVGDEGQWSGTVGTVQWSGTVGDSGGTVGHTNSVGAQTALAEQRAGHTGGGQRGDDGTHNQLLIQDAERSPIAVQASISAIEARGFTGSRPRIGGRAAPKDSSPVVARNESLDRRRRIRHLRRGGTTGHTTSFCSKTRKEARLPCRQAFQRLRPGGSQEVGPRLADKWPVAHDDRSPVVARNESPDRRRRIRHPRARDNSISRSLLLPITPGS